MQKEFNVTGLCVPNMHYMVNTEEKFSEIFNLIKKGKYFTINRARQFGKTTTIAELTTFLNNKDDYFAIETSFEGIGDIIFEQEETFSKHIVKVIGEELKYNKNIYAEEVLKEVENVNSISTLSNFISQFHEKFNKKTVFFIDEVDKSSNNKLFLNFIGMLRNKYLQRNKGKDYTFQSVILAGVHDIKTIKLKLDENNTGQYNSPWNIATDFNVKMNFNPAEITTMLVQYSNETGNKMDFKDISEKIFYFTYGYPFLVSKICKNIDEIIIPQRKNKDWTLADVETSFGLLTKESYDTTLFDSIVKELENNEALYDFIFKIIIDGDIFSYNIRNKLISLAKLHGIIREENGNCVIHNRVFEQMIYLYMLSTYNIKYGKPVISPDFFDDDSNLNIETIMLKFQQFMKEEYSYKDESFIEREGRLLFLSYLRPILNSKGYGFKEPVVADERRMDLVLVFNNKRDVIELKIWRGEKMHQKGLEQLSDYLDMYNLKKGYLLIYDFNENKTHKTETINHKDKEIYTVWV
ncbi:MAG: hypothetical protein B6I20_05075 [Bacteroidetes bacterium 4572_117]|nr:MAG: hypothetical protein B6I20_05075 [Bacteroidetes bacterium 4572_117]